jgi:DNA invertase Pin-like site-specific DNA recombinase
VGYRIGYGRVPGPDDDPGTQRGALEGAGCDEVFIDTASGKLARRPELDQALERLRPGDTFVITRLSRAMRSLRDLTDLAASLRARGVGLVVLDQGIDTTTPSGREALQVIEAVGEFRRELAAEATHEGLAAARARGRAGGRPRKLSAGQAALARQLYDERGTDGKRAHTVAQIAARFGVTRATIYRHLDLPVVPAAETAAAETAAAETAAAETAAAAAAGTAVVRTQYEARPGRRVIVVTDLADLRGPAHSTVTLPLRLYWSPPGRVFDLDDPFTLRSMYQTVLGEAARPEDLTMHLDRDTLIAVWPDLHLPKGVRQAWEEYHPMLRAARTPAA